MARGSKLQLTIEYAGDKVLRYGIELEANRAEGARAVVTALIQGNCFDVQCPVESLSLIYLNPPYDFELSEQRSQRMERLFLEHVYRWLRPRGVLVLVIPAQRIGECSSVLSAQFRDVRVYRLTEPESVRYGQTVLFCVRRSRHERERLLDSEIARARRWYELLARNPDEIQPLPSESDHQYAIPAGEPARLVYRGLPRVSGTDAFSRRRGAQPVEQDLGSAVEIVLQVGVDAARRLAHRKLAREVAAHGGKNELCLDVGDVTRIEHDGEAGLLERTRAQQPAHLAWKIVDFAFQQPGDFGARDSA